MSAQLWSSYASGQAPSTTEAEGRLEPPVDDTTRSFWSFQKVVRPPVPVIELNAWTTNTIDAFVLARLEKANLKPSPPAAKETLLRRAYYDLIGLPPSPERVSAFVEDKSEIAYVKVIDRLLASYQYGEKWARHWLDLVRYAETNSYERDNIKPHVWRYRDYVIRSLNQDKPYDQFVREQLAGDELPSVTAESIIATGYYRLGVWQDEPVDRLQELYEDLDDIARTTSEVLLGLTIGCARCHDHKLDPVPQRDYYRFLAFFRNLRRFGYRREQSVQRASVRPVDLQADSDSQLQQLAQLERTLRETLAEMDSLDALVMDKLRGLDKEGFPNESKRVDILKRYIGQGITSQFVESYASLICKRQSLFNDRPAGWVRALCVTEHGGNAPPTHVLIRGNAHAQGDRVEPGYPAVLDFPDPTIPPVPQNAPTSGCRRVLADWITNSENPLTARVICNRLWQYHFGRGIVRSANNFGFQGERPTHPALLDWLASELVAGDWGLKRMHRQIMLSSAYQMSSRARKRGLATDPGNDFFWRFDMRRLTAEEIRDSILAVNASLNREMFGPSIYPLISAEVKAGQSHPGRGWKESSAGQRSRRSVYIHVKRSLIVPLIAAFDGADVDASCPVRFKTVQPTQALGMMNGEFIHRQTRIFAKYIRERAGDTPHDQVTLTLQRTFQRRPDDAEVRRGVKLLDSLRRQHNLDAQAALEYFCVLAFNLNGFLYLD